MREKKCGIWPGLFASLVLSAVCGILVYQVTGFTYAIADDVIMRDIASGAFTGTPDGHLIFIQYVLGFAVSRLYLLNRSVDWYGFILAGALFLGLAAVLYRGMTAEKSLWWKTAYAGIVLGLFGVAIVPHAAQFEWTISAAMLGSASLYLYVTAGEKIRIGDGIFIWFLLALTYCIRYDVFFMVLPGFGIVFLWRFLRWKEKKFSFRAGELILPAAVFLTAGLVMLTEHFAYPGEEWKEFQRFQNARSQVYDYSEVLLYENNPAFFDELGLDEHDVRNIRHYALYLVKGMDAEMMEQVSLEAERQNMVPGGFKEKLWRGIGLTFREFTASRYFTAGIPALLFLLGGLVLAVCFEKKMLVPLLLFLLAEGALWLGLGYQGRLPERVAFSMYLVLLLGIAGVFYRLYLGAEKEAETAILRGWKAGKTAIQSRRRKNGMVLAVCLFCISAAAVQWVQVVSRSSGEPLNYQLFKEACKDDTDSFYFIETFMAEPLGGAMVTVDGDFRQNRCLTLGDWYSISPLDKKRFESLGISDVEQTIVTDPGAYLVVWDKEEPGFYETYFTARYPESRMVLSEVREIAGRKYYLYQVQR